MQHKNRLLARTEFRDPDRIGSQEFHSEFGSVIHSRQPYNLWWMAKPIGNLDKIPVGREEGVTVVPSVLPNRFVVSRSCEAEGLNVSRSGEKISQCRNQFWRQIEVDEQLQRAIFPRISSAAYSSAASTSSTVSQGKSLKISVCGAPDANNPRISATVVRVPRMIGWPDRTAGSIVIRLFPSGPIT